MMRPVTDPIVGIDLGTSNCSVAAVGEDGRPVVLADAQGRTVVPSVVSFHPSGSVLVGSEAKHRRQNDPRNTVFSVKRFMGRPYAAPEVAEARLRSSFAIERGDSNRPLVVTRAGKYTPEEISAIILDHMRKLAEQRLGTEVGRAVITVPANFNEAQRHATAAAAEIAGIVAVRLLNEPTAAAIAYGHSQGGKPQAETVAVYDFGGGTFDVSVLRLTDGVYEVLATAGDTFLGGDDLDNRLVEHEVKQFLALHHYDLRSDPQVIERLRAAIEDVKCELSTNMRAVVTAEGVAVGAGGAPIDLSAAITRDQFIHRVKDIVDRSFPVVEEALRLAEISPAQIDEVILVGGTTRIPYVRSRVAQFFAKAPRTDVDPEQAVALGAAIQAAGIAQLLDKRPAGNRSAALPAARPIAKPASTPPPIPKSAPSGPPPMPLPAGPATGSIPIAGPDLGGLQDVFDPPTENTAISAALAGLPPRVMEVTPQALSVATVGGFCELLLPRNTSLPIETTRVFSTARDEQSLVEITVVSGGSKNLEENVKLGTLVLSNLPPRPRGEMNIRVTFTIAADGILAVDAIDEASGIAQSARMELEGGLDSEAVSEARSRFLARQGEED
jgi:molecular chaperone DnaK